MRKITLLLLLVFASICDVFAQGPASAYGFSESTETYAQITGTTSTATGDDGEENSINIGFNFVFGGVSYSTFSISTNGIIKLGAPIVDAVDNHWTNTLTNGAQVNKPFIATFWDDNHLSTGTIRYSLTGTAPNQVLTVNWHNTKIGGTGSTSGAAVSTILRLYETTNVIEMVYSSPFTTTNTVSASVGLNDMTSFLSVTPAASSTASSVTANNSINATVMANLAGKKLIFTPPVACSGTPVAGSVTPASQNICSGVTPANLVASGFSTGVTGITFQWEESNDNGVADAWANAVGGSGATTASYTPPVFSGTPIYYRLNVTCSNSVLSAQTASVLITIPVAPTNQITAVTIPAASIGYSQATVNWTNGNGNRRAVFISNSPTFTDPVNGNAPALTANAVYGGSGQQLIYDGTAATVNVTGLSGGTQYYIKAYEYVRCGSGPYDFYFNTSTGTNIGNFTTCSALSVPALENFATYVPGCWIEADNGDLTAGPATFGTSAWVADGFGNVGTTGATRINLDATGDNDWLLSPLYTIPASGYELKFDASANQWNSTSAPTTAWEADDFVEVLVSTGTNNWTVLYTYNNGNVPSSTGSTNILDLDAYAGQTVRFAFRGVEGATDGGADIEFIVDNFEIRLTPSCSNPVSLVVNNLTFSAADISWAATTGNYQYILDNVATDPAGAGTTLSGELYNATLLSPSTTYYFHVRTVCAGPLYSVWSTISFTTPATPPSNDNCSGAIALTAGGSFGEYDVVGTTVGANTVTGLTYGCQANRANDVWYSVVVPASGSITIETQVDGASPLTDTVLSVFSGTCGALTEVGCSDDEGTGNFSILNLLGLTPGETLYIGVWRWSSATNGTFALSAYDASLGNDSFDLNGFKAYPNPVKDIFRVSYVKEISSISVHNLLGQEVLSQKVNALASEINLASLSRGTYLVKVNVDGLTNTIKVIKE
ncbi:T9SS type A sorting domain-containing protein [Flavobacterium amniphilum]|uniref:T9SS type A sorting domain-containing protein n=1 Tax=Flavobacterium amniphilum TaxID=1834035 RepID=UPI002029CA21|nr:T9SS type A sorting domain-containing protein [Flavobacterium amniphilum]MCL9805590.1 T9SS type A sorting domain-containing protein [Flavobacterium amniphilum]